MAQSEEFIFPGWEVTRKLGEGSFGGVYEIRRTLPGGRVEKCALKRLTVPRDSEEIRELYAQSFSKDSITAHYKGRMEELVNEYGIMQSLSGCPNIVNCHDIQYVQHDDGIGWDIYIRMELLYPLKKVLGSSYSEDMVCNLGIQLCNALTACHGENIIHRDIKPENILVSGKGAFKLGDFGIAKVSEKTGTGTLTGTYGYMAPEVANRQHYGASVDIYSLGMVLYWMMNRRTLPFLPLPPSIPTGAQRQQAQDRRLSGEPLPPPVDGSEALKKIVLKACAFAPAERYRSAEEMQAALQSCLSAPAAPRMQRQEPMAPPAPISEPTVIDTPTELEREPAVHANAPQQRQQIPVQQGRQRMAEKQTPEKEAPKKDAPKKKQKKPVIYHVMASLIAVALILACCGVGIVIFSYVEQRAETAKTEQAYQAALVLMEEGNYSDAADAFAALGDYGDSAAKEQEARQALELKEKKDAYQAAQTLMDEENYSDAADAFAALGDYSDSAAKEQEARQALELKEKEDAYQAAQTLMDEENYTGAANAFAALGNYSDSAAKEQEAQQMQETVESYQAAQALMDDGKYMQAMWALSGLNYRDSQEKMWEARDCYIASQRASLSAGNLHTVGLRNDGTVIATGANRSGQCNTGNWRNIVAVSAGGSHTVGLCSDGTVVATGSNASGQCQTGRWSNIVAISTGSFHTVGLRSDGTVVATGRNATNTSDWKNIVAVSAGESHTVGLRSDGTVVTTGLNGNGQRETGSWSDIVAVSAGNYHTVGLRSDGTVVATGLNSHGQCDVSSWTDIIAVSAGVSYTVGLRSDGTVVATGLNNISQCNTGNWTNIVAISAGASHTVGLRSDGTVVATGASASGQCNVSGWINISTAQAAPTKKR